MGKISNWRNRKEALSFSPYLYRARNVAERFFNRIKQCRRVATRYDKLAANYLAFIQLASIRLWLCVVEYVSGGRFILPQGYFDSIETTRHHPPGRPALDENMRDSRCPF
jgi:hypothetical protein